MHFPQQKVETAPFYLEQALRTTRTRLARHPLDRGTKLQRRQRLEQERLHLLSETLYTTLRKLTQDYPNLDHLTEFYTQLVQATLDRDQLKKSLATLHWAGDKIRSLTRDAQQRLRKTQTLETMKKTTQACLGRIRSVLQRIPFAYLESCRKTFRNYPLLKDLYTAAIAGFPNVGKSTLLAKLTTAKPEIAAYPFTTKTLNVGYLKKHPYTLQILDTPGTLARPEKMNPIEKQAHLALRYAAHLIIYVYDLTETSYPLAEQEHLHQKLQSLDKPLLVYLSKTDLLNPTTLQGFLRKHPDAYTSADALKQLLVEHAKLGF